MACILGKTPNFPTATLCPTEKRTSVLERLPGRKETALNKCVSVIFCK